MSKSVPPQMVGQEDGPNPLELFFEKNKKWIIAVVVLLVIGLGVRYGLREMENAARNKEWSSFNAAAGLSKQFEKKIELPAGDRMRQYWSMFFNMRLQAQITSLADDLKGADAAAIQREITAAKGKDKEPWLIWIAANKAYAETNWAEARKHLEDLQARFRNHLLCTELPYPPQVRPETAESKKEREAKERENRKKKKTPSRSRKDEKEYEPPKKGSMVGNLLAAIEREQAFEKTAPEFFKAPEPDKSETVVIKFAEVGEVEIAFYPDAAKKHVEEFKKNFTSGFYKGMHVHKIERNGKDRPEDSAPHRIFLGHPKSKDATDRAKWKEAVEADEKDMLEFEHSDKLSFFPGMVGAEQEKDGKSSARRFFITVTDGAARFDGEHVIFAKVIRGMDVLEEIVGGDMLEDADNQQGSGTPLRAVQVESTELKKAGK